MDGVEVLPLPLASMTLVKKNSKTKSNHLKVVEKLRRMAPTVDTSLICCLLKASKKER